MFHIFNSTPLPARVYACSLIVWPCPVAPYLECFIVSMCLNSLVICVKADLVYAHRTMYRRFPMLSKVHSGLYLGGLKVAQPSISVPRETYVSFPRECRSRPPDLFFETYMFALSRAILLKHVLPVLFYKYQYGVSQSRSSCSEESHRLGYGPPPRPRLSMV